MLKKYLLVILMLMVARVGAAAETVTGHVYHDVNGNGQMDAGEAGIAGVGVSNGLEVVTTDAAGSYTLPSSDDMVVFVVKPTGYATPVDANNHPQFYYVHKPAGSPAELQRYRGLAPTGDLPTSVNFALIKADEPTQFKAVINGDTQPYSDQEIDYVRDSFISDVLTNQADAKFCISMGDNVGDHLSLYPRYLATMGKMGMPVHYVPGNHDADYDVTNSADSYDTYKSHLGPTYYSFNYGQVHFVILCDVDYPSPTLSTATSKRYNGVISERQMQWLANDLASTPDNYLVVLNMHIPVVSDVDRTSVQHQVDNREDLYTLLAGRKVVSLGGHTHTMSTFLPGDEMEGWGQPTPIPQVIVGAACGSWWSGPKDAAGVPVSYMRGGAPRNYLVFDFNGNDYQISFKPTLQAADKQMHLSFLNAKFEAWYQANTNSDASLHQSRDVMTDRNILSLSDLTDPSAVLVANVYAGSTESRVVCQWDNGMPVEAVKTLNVKDPFALLNEMLYTTSLTSAGNSTHLWTCDIPDDLAVGQHTVAVTTTDRYGRSYTEYMAFEIAAD